MFAAKYQLKRVTVAIPNCTSFHSLCGLMSKKTLYRRMETWIRSVLKIIIECCELVKLCRINCSSPGFFETR